MALEQIRMCTALGLEAPGLTLHLLSFAEARALGRTCSAQSNRLEQHWQPLAQCTQWSWRILIVWGILIEDIWYIYIIISYIIYIILYNYIHIISYNIELWYIAVWKQLWHETLCGAGATSAQLGTVWWNFRLSQQEAVHGRAEAGLGKLDFAHSEATLSSRWWAEHHFLAHSSVWQLLHYRGLTLSCIWADTQVAIHGWAMYRCR